MSEKYGEGKTSWTPIGDDIKSFKGTFDGNGFEIQNLYINNNTATYQSLFANTTEATIKNLTVSGDITAKSYVEGIAGHSYRGVIENCCNKVNVSGQNTIGGIKGMANNVEIKYSYKGSS